MVYFSKKQLSSVAYTKQEADNKFAKLSVANAFSGNNTFNNPIIIGGSILAKKDSNSVSAIELTNQGEKSITFDFIQPTTGFRNYCNVFFRIKEANGSFQSGFKIQIQNTDANLVFSTDCNAYSFSNKEIKDVNNPTSNKSVANKQYVDNIVKYVEKVGGLSFTRQPLNQTAGQQVIKYYCNINYSTINIPNGKHIISCYSKTIPAQGAHLVITFFPVYQANQCLIEIYQYNSSTDITTNLNGATYCFTYLNV